MMESNSQIVSTLTYHLAERIMGWYGQTTNRTVHCIHLYTDTIATANNIFKLEHVHDMSYKPFSSGGTGLFYLHTNQGVFMFEIDVNPTTFIQAYKNLQRE